MLKEKMKIFLGIMFFTVGLVLIADHQTILAEEKPRDNHGKKINNQEDIPEETIKEDLPLFFKRELKAKKDQANQLLDRLAART